MFASYRSCLFIKRFRDSSSVSTVKLSLKDYILILFKLLASYIFFLAVEAITITAVNCKTSQFKRESSAMCNAL